MWWKTPGVCWQNWLKRSSNPDLCSEVLWIYMNLKRYMKTCCTLFSENNFVLMTVMKIRIG